MSTKKWVSDAAHCELGFKIRHLMLSNVSGLISSFQVVAETPGEDFTMTSITLMAEMKTITTHNKQRDTHLRSNDFFDAENYPELIFKSTGIERLDEENFRLNGNLTLKGITNPVTLNVAFSGVIDNPRGGGRKAGFTVNGKINRTKWGIRFNRVMESGGLGLGEEITIVSELQLVSNV